MIDDNSSIKLVATCCIRRSPRYSLAGDEKLEQVQSLSSGYNKTKFQQSTCNAKFAEISSDISATTLDMPVQLYQRMCLTQSS